MKRCLSLLSVVICLAIICLAISLFVPESYAEEQDLSFGDRVVFGHYEQDAVDADGSEEIQWIVLDTQGDRVLLISELVLDCQYYHRERSDITWENCSLRSWLNSEFFDNAFSEEEKSAILLTDVDNSAAQALEGIKADGGSDTKDRVFLLSHREYERYFNSLGTKSCPFSLYAQDRAKSADSDQKFTPNWWWLRSPGEQQNRAAIPGMTAKSMGVDVKRQGGIRPALWVDLRSGVFAAAVDRMRDPMPSVNWKGYELTPMYYEIIGWPSYEIIIRFTCEDVPLQLLYDEKENFFLINQFGPETYRSRRILVMENELMEGALDSTADFFDVAFDRNNTGLSQNITYCKLQLGDEEETVQLPPRGALDPTRCAFVTNEGYYAISLYSTDTIPWIAFWYKEAFQGADIRMCISGFLEDNQTSAFLTDRFLNMFDFASLDLTLSENLRLWDPQHPEIITRLNLGCYTTKGTYPSVKSLTYRIGRTNKGFVDFNACFPNLEELTLLIGKADEEGNVLNQNSKLLTNICGRLSKLTIVCSEETELPTDPELRAWIAAQRDAVRRLMLNGKAANKYDLSAGLEEDELRNQKAYSDRKDLITIFQTSGSSTDMEITGSDLGEKILVCITKASSDEISYTSAETGKKSEFSDIPKKNLAFSLDEADTVIRIYPRLNKIGTYIIVPSNKVWADAYECEIHVAVYSMKNRKAKLLTDKVVHTTYPPGTFEVQLNNYPQTNTGLFSPQLGIKYIASLLKP